MGELGQLVRSGNKIAAIKLYRELFGVGLKDAKEAVERLEQGKPVEVMHLSGGAYRNIQIDPAQFPPAPPSFQAPRPSSCLKPLLIIVFIFLLIGGTITFIITFAVNRVRDAVISQVPKVSVSNSKSNTSSGFASVALEFGSEGIGPGQFKDARSIGVDGEGRVYVGEYMGGRVQVFDAQGKFINEWTVDPKMPLRGMAVDRKGTAYVVQKGVITRYEGTTGKSLGALSYSGGAGFDDVAVTQDGGIVAATSGASDDIVRFNSGGQAIQTIRKAISSQTERSELNMRLAVDGLGNIYALGSFNNAIFKFTREGRFITRIGSTGNEAGQFRALSALAVDGQGHIFVSDTKGIQVFDTDGRYLDVFKVPNNVGFGLVFNDRNELLTASRNKVFKFTINKPGK
jgi:DNA-binding beta-propeller fold protein YncE